MLREEKLFARNQCIVTMEWRDRDWSFVFLFLKLFNDFSSIDFGSGHPDAPASFVSNTCVQS